MPLTIRTPALRTSTLHSSVDCICIRPSSFELPIGKARFPACWVMAPAFLAPSEDGDTKISCPTCGVSWASLRDLSLAEVPA